MSPVRRQAIITVPNADLLSIGPLVQSKYNNFVNENAFENLVCEMAIVYQYISGTFVALLFWSSYILQ